MSYKIYIYTFSYSYKHCFTVGVTLKVCQYKMKRVTQAVQCTSRKPLRAPPCNFSFFFFFVV